MYQMEPILKQILDIHRAQAEEIVRRTASKQVKDAFVACWNNLNYGSINASVSGEKIRLDTDEIIQTIDKWVKDFEVCREAEMMNLNRMENPMPQDRHRLNNIVRDIDFHILYFYESLKQQIDRIGIEFSNTARAYHSPIQQALNDMNRLYNEMNDIKGPFSGFKNVSVYIHGIEDNGDDFINTAVKVSEPGDIIFYENRDGTINYYLIEEGMTSREKSKPIEVENTKEIIEDDNFSTRGRLHYVYITESENEHRSKTSNDLAENLIELGLINSNIDMFGHSYGGRRTLQFAIDYPENIRSITTIGTPYDRNMLSTLANYLPNTASKYFNRDSKEFSDYLDFNPINTRKNNGIVYSNAYTDMTSEAMKEHVDYIKTANPEVYQRLEQIDITAASGRDYTDRPSRYHYKNTVRLYDSHDGAVSVTSQNAESLGDLINYRPVYEVEGESLNKPAHSFQIRDDDFINLIKQVNSIQVEYE